MKKAGLPRQGVVAENFVPALRGLCLQKTLEISIENEIFERCHPPQPYFLPGCPETPGGVQKVVVTSKSKLRAHFSFPIFRAETSSGKGSLKKAGMRKVANPPTTYGIQKHPEPQNLSKNCPGDCF